MSQALDDLLVLVDDTRFSYRQKQLVRNLLHAIQKLVIAQRDHRVVVAAGHLMLAFRGLLEEGLRSDFDTEDLLHKLRVASLSPPAPRLVALVLPSSAMPSATHPRLPRASGRWSRDTRLSPLRPPTTVAADNIVDGNGGDSEEFDDDDDGIDNPFVTHRWLLPARRYP